MYNYLQDIILCCSRWPFKNDESEHTGETVTASMSSDSVNCSDNIESSELKGYLLSWLSDSADNIVILILLLALTVKFIFFEDRGDIVRQLRFKEKEDITKKVEFETGFTADNVNTINNTNTSPRPKFDITLPPAQPKVFPMSGIGGGWIDIDDEEHEYIDKAVQTDTKFSSVSDDDENSSLEERKIPRSVEDCLQIYKSEVRMLII